MSEHVATIGVIIASIAVITTFVGIYLSNKKTSESNELLRKDIENKLRPWIRIEGCKPTHAKFSDGEVVEWKDMPAKKKSSGIPVISVKITSTLTNFGNTPCYMVSYFYRSDSMFERTMLINDKMKNSSPTICMPQGKVLKTLEVPVAIWDMLPTKPFFTGTGIIYKLNEDTEVEMGKIWKMKHSGNEIEDDWYEEIQRTSLKIK